MARYVRAADDGLRWNEILGNTTYRSTARVTVATADPLRSNSASTYVALLSNVLNGGTVVTEADAARVAPRIAAQFARQGLLENTDGALAAYLEDGMARAPMVLTYESDYLARQLRDDSSMRSDMTLMYPSPTVVADNFLIAMSQHGAQVGDLLTNDPRLRSIEAEYGWRVPRGDFEKALALRHSSVPTRLDTVPVPAYRLLQQVLDRLHGAPTPANPTQEQDGPPAWVIS